MLRPISEVAQLSSNTLLRICKFVNFPRNSSIGSVSNVKLGYCKKHLLKQLIKSYTNKFIENVRQYVTKATFSEITEDRGQKHI